MARPPKKERGLYTRKDASGTLWWYYRVYLNGREQRGGPYETKGEAKDARGNLTSDHRRGKVDPEGGWQLIRDVLDQHVRDRAKKKDQASQRRFCAWWKTRCQAAGLIRIRDLTIRFLEEVRDELKHERIKIGPTPRAVKHKKRKLPVGKLAETVGKYREGSTLNRYFRWLCAALGKVKSAKRMLFDDWTWESEGKGRTRHLDPTEELALMAALGPHANMARLAILTGLRQAEQFTLQWSDVDLERNILTLPRTKSGDVQYVYLSEEAAEIVRTLNSWQRSKWVFPSLENPANPLEARNFYHRIWIPAVKRAGIEWATWHDLRHTYASRLGMSGYNESTIAALLRHSGTGLVKRYTHINQPHLKQAVEAVAQFGKGMGSSVSEGQTGKKPESVGEMIEGIESPNTVQARVRTGKKVGAPDTN